MNKNCADYNNDRVLNREKKFVLNNPGEKGQVVNETYMC